MDTFTLPQSLFTVGDLIAALSSLVMAIYIIMSFLKGPLKTLAKWLTKKDDGDWIVRPATVVVSFLVLAWLMKVQGIMTIETIGLAVINSFLVAFIAGAAHDYIVTPTKSKSDKKIIEAVQGQLDLIMKSQVPDVSPPIITPQPTSEITNDPEPIAPAI